MKPFRTLPLIAAISMMFTGVARGQSLAELYEVETKVLVQAVKRNITRFPDDFMFQLDAEEFRILKSQSVTSSWRTPRS